MKTIYFVRHGETRSNFLQVPGHHTDPLSERGRIQAELVANRLAEVGIEVVISSPYIRAHQTAAEINVILAKEIVLDASLEEIKAVSALRGTSRTDSESQKIRKLRLDNITDPSWHFADEENFFDANKRSEVALDMLLARPEGCILAVTHGAFLRALMRTMMFGNLLTPELYLKTYYSFGLSNTGVTVCEHDENRGWQLMRWNDTVHLSPEVHTH